MHDTAMRRADAAAAGAEAATEILNHPGRAMLEVMTPRQELGRCADAWGVRIESRGSMYREFILSYELQLIAITSL
jgi:hypothetical protein